MPPRKKQPKKKDMLLRPSEVGMRLSEVNVSYDRALVESRLQDLTRSVEQRISAINEEVRSFERQLRAKVGVELVKIPADVRNMSVRRFREEFGEDLTAAGLAALRLDMQNKRDAEVPPVTATPAPGRTDPARQIGEFTFPATPATVMQQRKRAPRADESMVLTSMRGSPLGTVEAQHLAPDAVEMEGARAKIQLVSGEVIEFDSSRDISSQPAEVQELRERTEAQLAKLQRILDLLPKQGGAAAAAAGTSAVAPMGNTENEPPC